MKTTLIIFLASISICYGPPAPIVDQFDGIPTAIGHDGSIIVQVWRITQPEGILILDDQYWCRSDGRRTSTWGPITALYLSNDFLIYQTRNFPGRILMRAFENGFHGGIADPLGNLLDQKVLAVGERYITMESTGLAKTNPNRIYWAQRSDWVEPEPQPLVVEYRKTGKNLILSVPTESGKQYQIQRFDDDTWTTIETITGTGNKLDWVTHEDGIFRIQAS